MTRERHIAILRYYGGMDEKRASVVVDRFLEEVELERAESVPPVVEFPMEKARSRSQGDRLPPPSLNDASGSLVRDTTAANPTPLNVVPKPTFAATEESNERYWGEQDLAEYLVRSMPPAITINPDGRTEPLTIYRQIDPLVGLGLVKVSYRLQGATSPVKSERNIGGGEMERMTIDSIVSQTFSCFQEQQPIEDKLESLRLAANQVFGPHKERIVSTTKVRNTFNFTDDVPHESV